MPESKSQKIKEHILKRYGDNTKKSKKHNENARKFLPGGDTRTATYYFPHPIYMGKGKGFYLYDCDGNRYIDFLNNYTSLIHGHAHPRIIEVAQSQLERGTVLGTPAEIQYKHAEHIIDRVPSIEQVRYCNSGTEATLFAMRAARAHTGKDAFIKMDGGFHGTHDYVEVNVNPDASGKDLPVAHVERGVPSSVLNDVLIAPFNNLDAVENILQKNKARVAGIIIEPMLSAGGGIPPGPGYLKGMRELADHYEVLLIFDEIVTFRMSRGGMQDISGVHPDLTAFGKIIGGGFPIGAFGGRREIMEIFNPAHPESTDHSGTFNGNNITLVAGLVAMEMYDQESINRLNKLGDRLRNALKAKMEKVGIKGQVIGYGSVIFVVWKEEKNTNAHDTLETLRTCGELPSLLQLEMINRGIYIPRRGMFALSTPMTEIEVDKAVTVFGETLEILKPYVVETLPHLVSV
jgi:glutamate-1-semialdehyde 2,1-aminomutase